MSASSLFRNCPGFQVVKQSSQLWRKFPSCPHVGTSRRHSSITRRFFPRSLFCLPPCRQGTDCHTCNMRLRQSVRLLSISSRNGTFLLRTAPCLTSRNVSVLVCSRQMSTEASAVQVSTETTAAAALEQVSTSAVEQVSIETTAVEQVSTAAAAAVQVSPAASAPSGLYADLFGPDSPPVQAAMTLLQSAHLQTGLPWWATIVMTTAVLRLGLTFPLAVYQAQVIARVELLAPELGRFAAALRRQVSVAGQQRGWTEKQMRRKFNLKMREFRTSLYIRDNCHPFKGSLLVWVQLPLFVCVSFALRHLTGTFQGVHGAATLQPDMVSQGALWFTDLTAADPTLLLPVLLGTLNLVIVEMHSLQQVEKTRTQAVLTNFFRGISVLMVMVAAYMPAAMTLYWTSSSAVGLAQNILLKLPRLRQACRIPPTPRDSPTPFRDMAATLRRKLAGKEKTAAKS
ncbi:cytochrome c oxidase assembly protein COX18, mitochondrial-like isoform X1 [Branchiostoma floridae x Branchiostoma belcheri]